MGALRRKGTLEETVSFALYGDDSRLFTVTYRDRDIFRKVSLNDFLFREDLSDIPVTRITEVARESRVVWRKGQKVVSVKKSK